MDFEYISKKFPSGDFADGDRLYRSLGSFWTQVFQEQETLRGYTLGMAEELIQSYYDLVKTLNTYSVKDIPVLSLKRWQPLVIKRSSYNNVPFKFEPGGATFGLQPESDRFYAGKSFRFGFSKSSNNNVFSFKPDFELRKFSLIADRIIGPTVIAMNGVDVIVDASGVLYFNQNIFENENIPKAFVVGEDGAPAQYRDTSGNLVEDEMVILWLYHAESDEKLLADNFGKIIGFELSSSEGYKAMLRGIIDLFVSGATVNSLKNILAAFCGVSTVVHPVEIVEDVYSDGLYRYVVTDKEVYRFEITQSLLSDIRGGSKVYGGDILVDLVQYYDTVLSPSWWTKELEAKRIALSSHIFVGSYKHQLFFANNTSLATLNAEGKIVFPVEGSDADVKEFHNYLNHPDNISGVKLALGLINPGNVAVVNPLNFVFQNFLKNNTGLIKFNFSSPEELSRFFSYLPVIREYLPPHVYLLFYINLNLPSEVYGSMNSRYTLPTFGNVPLSQDGSLPNGQRPRLGENDPEYYKNYLERLFCISVSPKAENDETLFHESNLDQVTLFSSGTPTPGQPRVIDGKVFTHIPTNQVVTSRHIPTVLIIDFS